MKKITFVITKLENFGGTERVAILLANELAKHYEVTILSQKISEPHQSFNISSTVNDVRLASGNLRFPLAVKKYIKEHPTDLIVIHTMTKLTPILLLLGLKHKNIWSLEHISFRFSPKRYQVMRKLLYKRLTMIVTLTESDKSHYAKINNNVNVIYNASPIPITKKPYSNNSKVVISIGHLTYRKGYDLLLESWKSICFLYPDWVLQIYGEGPDLEKLTQFCKSNKLTSVEFMGKTANPIDAYDKAAFYVLSSRFEGFGLVLLEAQSRGLPTISFDCPYGPAEIINSNQDGILVPSENTYLMSEALLKLIESSSTREYFSKNAIKNSHRFDKKTIIQRWIDLIEDSI